MADFKRLKQRFRESEPFFAKLEEEKVAAHVQIMERFMGAAEGLEGSIERAVGSGETSLIRGLLPQSHPETARPWLEKAVEVLRSGTVYRELLKACKEGDMRIALFIGNTDTGHLMPRFEIKFGPSFATSPDAKLIKSVRKGRSCGYADFD